jgi:pilus assembly protein Flp/PilA
MERVSDLGRNKLVNAAGFTIRIHALFARYRLNGLALPQRIDLRMNALLKLLRNEDGATAIEYGLIAALIVVSAVTVMGTVGTNLSSVFNTVAGNL